jgi:3-phosphoshikimate 1-carboxyvinyltransferase
VIRAVGGDVHATPRGLEVSFARGTPRHGIAERNFKAISDTFLTLAALAPLLSGPTRITGIAHTRKQETDRVAGMARELTRLGQRVIETEDALEIHPQALRAGQTIETYHDHRFAMSFGVLGCHDLHGDGAPWLTVRDPACCAKTFPHFFELLEGLRQKSLAG